jgi:hypothetical protein
VYPIVVGASDWAESVLTVPSEVEMIHFSLAESETFSSKPELGISRRDRRTRTVATVDSIKVVVPSSFHCRGGDQKCCEPFSVWGHRLHRLVVFRLILGRETVLAASHSPTGSQCTSSRAAHTRREAVVAEAVRRAR